GKADGRGHFDRSGHCFGRLRLVDTAYGKYAKTAHCEKAGQNECVVACKIAPSAWYCIRILQCSATLKGLIKPYESKNCAKQYD
ncbi:MAG: hypothetical protein ABIH17_06025, partial [Pseudomonadota bacterium]